MKCLDAMNNYFKNRLVCRLFDKSNNSTNMFSFRSLYPKRRTLFQIDRIENAQTKIVYDSGTGLICIVKKIGFVV